MNIDSIKNGYVIDHIKTGEAIRIYKLLNLEELDSQVALITNAKSKKTGTKDLLKIAKLIDIDLDKIAFIDPGVIINVVKNNKIIEKKKIKLPEKLINVCRCSNPRCITSIERDLDQEFYLVDSVNKKYRCKYCDSLLDNNNLILKNN